MHDGSFEAVSKTEASVRSFVSALGYAVTGLIVLFILFFLSFLYSKGKSDGTSNSQRYLMLFNHIFHAHLVFNAQIIDPVAQQLQ